MRFAVIISFVVLTLSVAPAETSAQQTRRAAPVPRTDSATEQLASGWAALAAGRTADAEAAADRLLQAATLRHDAVSLKIRSRVQGGGVDAALDVYDKWVADAPHEDVFFLQPIARATLDAQSKSTDVSVRIEALRALAEAGDKTAAARLSELASSPGAPGTADEALAELGNQPAMARLADRVSKPGPRGDVSSSIDALVKAKAMNAVPAIASALAAGRPLPTKLSAARGLGELGARGAIPQLQQALKDPDPPVRMMAAAALSRLGDQSGIELVRQMESSPVSDIRLMLAETTAEGNPDGTWVSTATAALQDPDPLARVSAAKLLLKHAADPAAAMAALGQALSDANPAMRLVASQALADVPRPLLGTDLPTLRRLLRDPSAQVKIAAAGAVLKLAGGVD